jgi:hypothetical protein
MHKISDLGLAAYLMTRHRLVDVEEGARAALFIFPPEAAMDEAAYWQDGPAPARQMAINIRDLKARLFTLRERRGGR